MSFSNLAATAATALASTKTRSRETEALALRIAARAKAGKYGTVSQDYLAAMLLSVAKGGEISDQDIDGLLEEHTHPRP